jgi:hypothetical protein
MWEGFALKGHGFSRAAQANDQGFWLQPLRDVFGIRQKHPSAAKAGRFFMNSGGTAKAMPFQNPVRPRLQIQMRLPCGSLAKSKCGSFDSAALRSG